ncbi:Lrp/AsnC ligand binding domain-containing protein [Phaeobacter sp.]|uniref:Lrp/AsnC family transcriptional regulator n=1 Tax=Phaeobacter sp. TaxID=1902409 RepID=UPI0025E7CEF3|nr:Lrp/AsnC ligand binding domain-containing protein [Phaeobacter sp.]
MKPPKDSRLDRFDQEIMRILSREGRLPITELSARVGLSKTPCQVRLKRLMAEGFILGFEAVLNPVKLNLEQVAFVEVKLSDTTEAALSAFNVAVSKVPEVEQCHMIAGAFDYLIKIRTSNMRTFREVLGRTISTLPHVSSTSTHVSMQSVKDSETF